MLILLHTEPSEQFVLLLFVVLSIIILSPFFPMSLSPRSNYSTSLEVLIGSSKIISKLSKQVQTCQNWPNLVKICLNGLKKSKFFQSVLNFQSWCKLAQIVLNFFCLFQSFYFKHFYILIFYHLNLHTLETDGTNPQSGTIKQVFKPFNL